MTLFQHTLGQLLRGEKTETSRLALPLADGEHIVGREMIQYPMGNKAVMRGTPHGWRLKWQVGRDYAIQPARGVKSIGQYRIVDIWWQDVRTLSINQIKSEGFWPKGTQGEEGFYHFMQTWIAMHDRQFEFKFDPRIMDYRVREGRVNDIVSWGTVKQMIDNRPSEPYQAWRMKIEVLWDTVDWDSQYVRHLDLNLVHVGTIETRNGFTDDHIGVIIKHKFWD